MKDLKLDLPQGLETSGDPEIPAKLTPEEIRQRTAKFLLDLESPSHPKPKLMPRLSPDEISIKNRLNAFRGHLIRKLEKVFDHYEPFTVEEAKARTRVAFDDLYDYLHQETQIPASRITQLEDGRFQIVSRFHWKRNLPG